MAKGREINMNLPSADDLFTTQEEREQKNQEYVKEISIYAHLCDYEFPRPSI